MTLNRWAALFAVLTAVLVIGGVFISGDTPDGDAPDADWVSYVKDDESAVITRAYLFIGAGLSLVALYAFGLNPRLTGPRPTDAAMARLGAAAAVLAAAAMAGAGLVGAAVGAAEQFGDVPIDPSLARLFDNFIYGFLLIGAALPLGVVMGVVAVQALRRQAFPKWFGWLSILGVIGMLCALIFIPFVLLPVWLIALAVVLFRSSEPVVA
jgi:hypothetical protein